MSTFSKNSTSNLNLNPKYTFESFVAGPRSQFVHAACLAVANPGQVSTYNPLFIYGGAGLGKTHLINAIGNRMLSIDPTYQISYLSIEKFINEFITAIQYEELSQFREKYRNVDLLLLDDIQFLSGKEQTQEEFFHTFNTLYENNKQIVITSDKPPKEIITLEERLRSRFEWGLIADIQPPEMETKVAILKKKAEENHVNLPDDVALFIATNIVSNVRELEGSLLKIRAYSEFSGHPITIEFSRDVLKDIIKDRESPIREVEVGTIKRLVAEEFNIRVSDFKSPKRLKKLATARQIAMYLTRSLTSMSFPEIGEHFGGKHYSTVIHATNKITEMMERDSTFRMNIESLKKQLLSNDRR